MTNSIIPYSFTPGTKAKAQEVNANFNALAEKIKETETSAIHTNSNSTVSGELTFSAPIYSSGKHHDTKGNFTIINIAEEEFCDAILAFNNTELQNSAIRIINGDGFNEIVLKSFNEDGSSSASIGLKNTDGISYAYAPTYSENYSDNSDKIVTTKFLSNRWTTTKGTTSSTASTNRPAVVIQNYKSNASWYRIWSDGWKEQGGRVKTGTNTKITFLKAFSDANYTFSAYQTSTGASSSSYFNASYLSSKAAASFTFVSGETEAPYFDWFACGY